ncbi:Mur ligase [Pisolithus croceorrhizus]|nr:Mur ligase [Pisolithus croceorrhizus]
MSIDLTLERVHILASQFSYTRPSIHVTGTNGKGSVACLLASILQASSFKVGKFNTPHLISIYDCITINDQPVTPELYHECRTQIEQANERVNASASSFELLTVTALLVFERVAVDIAIVEVGMGGRLDATNVMPDQCILVSALTTVDLDHQAFLGETVDLIAREKAAIARQGKPFILGHQKHSSVVSAAEGVVLQQGGTFMRNAFGSPIRAMLPLHGTHQLHNLSLALTIISTLLTDSSCCAALPPQLLHAITDGDRRLSFHTMPRPESLSLTRCLHITYILALSHSPPKTPEQTVFPLLPPRSIAVLRFPSSGWNAVGESLLPLPSYEQPVLSLVTNANMTSLQRALEWTELQAAQTQDEGGEHLAVLAGSLYLVADFYRLMKRLEAPNFTV